MILKIEMKISVLLIRTCTRSKKLVWKHVLILSLFKNQFTKTNFFLFFLLERLQIHKCRHDEIFANMEMEPSPQKFKSVLNQQKLPIRIFFDFNTIEKNLDPQQCKEVGQSINNGFGTVKCDEADIITEEKLDVLKKTFDNITSYVNSLIKVNRLNEPIILQNNWGEPVDKRSISDTDLVVTVYLRPYGNDTILAAAAATRYETSSGRSIQGLIYITLKEVPDEPQSIDSPVRFFFDTCLHELIHVLGMSGGMMSKWIDPATGSRYKAFPLKYVTFPQYEGKTFRLLQTPNAINVSQRRFNRTYFKDDILMGIEIEEKGGSGTEGSHVKGRTYYSDMMTGIVMPPSKVSEITLALLEDMGWYECNWSLAEPLAWGDGQSMGKQKMKSFPFMPPDYFPEHYQCYPERANEKVCNYDFSGVSHCGAQEFVNQCPTSISYMKDVCNALTYYDTNGTHWFGPSDCHDFMRVLKAREYLLCAAHWTYGNESEIADTNFMTFGKESMCSQIVGKDQNGKVSLSAGCYNMFCSENGSKEIIVETTKGNVTCKEKGQRISIDFMTLICPDFDLICPLKDFNKNYKTTKPTNPFSYDYQYEYHEEELFPEENISNEPQQITEDNSSDKSIFILLIIIGFALFLFSLVLLIVAIVIIRKNSLKAESPELLNSKITDIKEDKVLITI